MIRIIRTKRLILIKKLHDFTNESYEISIMNINSLKEALKTLKDVQLQYVKNSNRNLQSISADSCVKRFEYTLETSVKLMKKMLKTQYAKEETDLTVNNIFRLMQSYGFISFWISWRNYYQ